jgi:hypothetical protein
MTAVALCSETGVREIDAGNEGLRYLLQRLFEPGVECRRGRGGKGDCDFSQCSRIEAIIRYVTRNFARQEQVMAQCGYSNREAHCNDHSLLVDGLKAMQRACLCADRQRDTLCEFIESWMSAHFAHYDWPLGKWAATHQLVEA